MQGGNRIPASYLKRFLPSQGKDTHEEMPWELRRLLEGTTSAPKGASK